MPCRKIPISSEARKSSRDSLIGARTASAIAKRMSAAAINLIARKKSGSPEENAYLATTKPELQISMNIQGARATSRRIVT
jgi:hypothetical protein